MNALSSQKLKSWTWHILALIFFAYIFSITTNFVLSDPDIWWHLKTGEYISKTKSIPNDDVFSFTTPKPLTEGQKQGLRANWLGQVILYSSYRLGGFTGVGFFRGLLVVLPMFTIYLWLIERRMPVLPSLTAVCFSSFILSTNLAYAFERPQGMSFLFSLFAIILLEELKSRRAKALVLLPVLMVLWSNIHGGFAVGIVIIGLYIFGEMATYLFKKFVRRSPEPFNKIFFGGALLGIAGSGLNPNGFSLIYGYLRGLASMFLNDVAAAVSRQGDVGWVQNVILEYKPLIFFYRELHYVWLIYYWIFLGALMVLVLAKYAIRRKFDFTEFLTLCFVNFFANYYARGLMFSLVISAFYLGKSLLEIWDSRKYILPRISTAAVTTVFSLLFFLITCTFIFQVGKVQMWAFKPGIVPSWITPWFPMRAIDFMRQEKIAPPMYNFYTWGGFLIFATYPEYQVFVDGRALDDNVNRKADAVLKAYAGWDRILDDYNVNFLLVPVVYIESGDVIPLVKAIIPKDEWKLVYLQKNSAIYVRNNLLNRSLIQRYPIDKRQVYYGIIEVEDLLAYRNPYNPIIRKGKADALQALGYYEEAQEIYNTLPVQFRHSF